MGRRLALAWSQHSCWLREIAAARGVTPTALMREIDQRRSHTNLTLHCDYLCSNILLHGAF
jgi:predicted DNA-binding ribbon-helix-helix protein